MPDPGQYLQGLCTPSIEVTKTTTHCHCQEQRLQPVTNKTELMPGIHSERSTYSRDLRSGAHMHQQVCPQVACLCYLIDGRLLDQPGGVGGQQAVGRHHEDLICTPLL